MAIYFTLYELVKKSFLTTIDSIYYFIFQIYIYIISSLNNYFITRQETKNYGHTFLEAFRP